MVATDGSDFMEAQIEKFHAKYPFGEWEKVVDQKEIAYTGRQISVHGNEIHVGQADFVNGRMDEVPLKREKNRSPESACTPTEHAEFRSGVGNLHWATSQSRVDHAVDTSRLQKRQNAPTHADYKDLVKVVKEVKDTADVVIKIRPIQNMAVGAFTDSSLYGSQGELIPDDEALAGYDKHKLHSQGGSLLVVFDKTHLDDLGDVPFSFADWRTRASRRVLHSTFAAEAQAGVETFGLAKYYRAYMCDILFGYADWKDLDSYGETELPIVMFTDCKSLYDNLKKEGSVPDDKWVAVPIASLRGAVSAGPGRDTRKSECRWVPSRWQLADCLTKKGLAASFRERIASGTTRLHEESLQSVKRKKEKLRGNTNYTWCCYSDTTRGSEPRSDYDNDDAQVESYNPPFLGKPLSASKEPLPGTPLADDRRGVILSDTKGLGLVCPDSVMPKKKKSKKKSLSPPQEAPDEGTSTGSGTAVYTRCGITIRKVEDPLPEPEKLDRQERQIVKLEIENTERELREAELEAVQQLKAEAMQKSKGKKIKQRARSPGAEDRIALELQTAESAAEAREKEDADLAEKLQDEEDAKKPPSSSDDDDANPGVRTAKVREERERERYLDSVREYHLELDEVLQMEDEERMNYVNENELCAFNSLDHWGKDMANGQGVTLTFLPKHLELYALRTNKKLRLIFRDSFEEYHGANIVVHVFRMPEERYNGMKCFLLWVGLILLPENYDPELILQGRIDCDIMHGTTLSRTHKMARNPTVTLDRGNRNRKVDNVRPKECYGGPWWKTLEYVKMQMFGKVGSETQDLGVISVVGLRAESVRVSKGYKKQEVLLAEHAWPRIILLRYDNERLTLGKVHRHMSDYDENQHEGSRFEEENRRNPPPWARKLPARQIDMELKENSEKMMKLPDQNAFYRHDGTKAQTNAEVRAELKKEFEESYSMDEDGWPIGSDSPVQPTWCYSQWVEDRDTKGLGLVCLDVPGRPKPEIAFTVNRRHVPSKMMKAEILEAIKKLRDGEITSKDPVFKKFDLHEIANVCRHSSPSMHTHLLRTYITNFTRAVRQIKAGLNAPKDEMSAIQLNNRSGVDDDRIKEIVQLEEKVSLCKSMLAEHNTYDPKKFKCPIWLGHVRSGMRKYDATCLLRERIDSALHNMSKQYARGVELLCQQEDHYHQVSNPPAILEVDEIEWSDDEVDFNPNVQDDVEHPTKYRPSSKWMEKHYALEDSWKTEVEHADAQRGYAQQQGGKFNQQDGRYHSDQKNEKALAKHAERTIGRKTCHFYTMKSWCQYGFDCTCRHIPYDEFAYQNFDSRAYKHPKGKGKLWIGKGKGKGKGKKGKDFQRTKRPGSSSGSDWWPDKRQRTRD